MAADKLGALIGLPDQEAQIDAAASQVALESGDGLNPLLPGVLDQTGR